MSIWSRTDCQHTITVIHCELWQNKVLIKNLYWGQTKKKEYDLKIWNYKKYYRVDIGCEVLSYLKSSLLYDYHIMKMKTEVPVYLYMSEYWEVNCSLILDRLSVS